MLHGRIAACHFSVLPQPIAAAPEVGSLTSTAKSWIIQDSLLIAWGY